MSLIKSIRRFTISMGTYTTGGVSYWTLGSATSISSTDYVVQIYSPDGPAARFCFAHFPVPFNPHKTFLSWTTAGHSAGTQQSFKVRICGTNGYPPSSSTSFTQIQLTHYGNWPISSFNGGISTAPEISVELVEFF